MRHALPTAVLLSALLAGGCSGTTGKPDAPPEPAAVRGQALDELGQAYREYAEEKRRPPARVSDLKTLGVLYQSARHAVGTGEVVPLFGGVGPDPNTVIACEKETPTAGGRVLTRGGTVKAMTAAEFAAAPKGTK